MYMKLQELSHQYRTDAEAFAGRIHHLEQRLRHETDPAAARRLQQRIAELQPLLRQSRAMAQLTEHYYDRGYSKHGSYRF